MQRFNNVINEKNVFPIGATKVDDNEVYFVTEYNNILYRLDVNSGNTDEILMPIGNELGGAYRKICVYDRSILLLSFNEAFCLEYNLDTKEFVEFANISLINAGNRVMYVDCILCDDELYLLDKWNDQLVVMDVKKREVFSIISLRQEEGRRLCTCIKRYKNNLLIFGEYSRYFLKINKNLKRVDKIETEHKIRYAEIVDNTMYYMVTTNRDNGIYCMSLEDNNITKIGSAQLNSKYQITERAFWNPKKINESIYFLPCEHSEMVVLNVNDNKVEVLNIEGDGYISRRPNKECAIIDILDFDERLLLIPYMGNIIFVMKRGGEIENKFFFKVREELIMKEMFETYHNGKYFYESVTGLEGYIDFVRKV